MIVAGIDIGSNAVRLNIAEVNTSEKDNPVFTRLNFIRIPLRLGFDVFKTGSISELKSDKLLKTMQAFKQLMSIYDVDIYLACATSAMRDAENGDELVRLIKKDADLDLKIISGADEAALLFETHIAETLDNKCPYLYIDVGGGSTELTLFYKQQIVFKESFNIGTIRLLNDSVEEEQWEQMKNFVKNQTKKFIEIRAIGSGGNINKVFSLSKRKEGRPLNLELLQDYYREFSNHSLEQRMRIYKFKRDRADVIVPALKIYASVMQWAKADEIYVPKIGLSDGLVTKCFQMHQAITSE